MELGRVCVLIATYCRARLFIVAWLDDKEVPKGSLNLPTGQQSPHSRQHSLENNERVLARISEATHRDAGMHLRTASRPGALNDQSSVHSLLDVPQCRPSKWQELRVAAKCGASSTCKSVARTVRDVALSL